LFPNRFPKIRQVVPLQNSAFVDQLKVGMLGLVHTEHVFMLKLRDAG